MIVLPVRLLLVLTCSAAASPAVEVDYLSRCPSYPSDRPSDVVLVTGGSGMIGSYLVDAAVFDPDCLLGPRRRVLVALRWRSNLRNLRVLGVWSKVEPIYVDVTDAHHVLQVVESHRPTVIFHFAAQAINGVSMDAGWLSLDVNIRSTHNILEAVRRLRGASSAAATVYDPHVLIAGSSAEYGLSANDYDGRAIPESAPLRPLTPYGVSKVAQENLAVMYAYAHKMHTNVARIFIHLAPGGTPHTAVQDFAKQIAELEAAYIESGAFGVVEHALLHGDLSTKRDMTDVADSARIFIQLAKIGIPGEVYNVGSKQQWSIGDLLERMLANSRRKFPNLRILGQIDPKRLRKADEKTLLAENAKLVNLTGWKPKPDMEKTLGRILDYWRYEVMAGSGGGAGSGGRTKERVEL